MKISDEEIMLEDNESKVSQGSWLTQCQTKKKRSKAEAGTDRISGLPNSILVTILTFLPIKTAVQSRLLSKSWFHIWRFAFSIDFDCRFFIKNDFLHRCDRRIFRNSHFADIYHKFVDSVLRLHDYASDIVKIRYLHQKLPDDFFTLLQNKHVQVLDITADIGDFKRLFTFSRLRVLELKPYSTFPLGISFPTSVYLPCLKILHFDRICFLGPFHRLFFSSSCPALETLHLECCSFLRSTELCITFSTLRNLTLKEHLDPCSLIISAPNLRLFNYNGRCMAARFTNQNFPLSKVCLSPFTQYMNEVAGTKFAMLIKSVRCCESLSLHCCQGLAAIVQQNIDFLRHIQIHFPYLKCLNMTTSFYYGQCLFLSTILNNSPNLEILVLEKDEVEPSSLGYTRDKLWWSEVEWAIPHLKMVEIRRFRGCTNGVMFVKSLLRKASVLEKISIEYDENGLKDKIGEYLGRQPRVCSSTKTSTSVVLFLS